jgi:hypothetical protein
MPWFKVDDNLALDDKVLSIPRSIRTAAMGLWTLAGSWSAHQLRNGHVPKYMISELAGTKRQADALVEAGLWRSVDDGYAFHNWVKFQPTREEIEAAREAERVRKAEWRARKAAKNQGSEPDVPRDNHGTPTGVPGGVPPESALPDPTRPEPDPTVSTDVETSEGAAPRPATSNRGTRISQPFIVTTAMRGWAAERVPGLDVNRSTETFVNHWRAKSGKDATKIDWIATWRNWLIRDFDDGRHVTRTGGSPGPQAPPSKAQQREQAHKDRVAQLRAQEAAAEAQQREIAS